MLICFSIFKTFFLYFGKKLINQKTTMKKIILFSLLMLVSLNSFAQKKKKKSKSKKETSTKLVLASANDLVFEMNTKNGQNKMYLLAGKTKDSIQVKSFSTSDNLLPSNPKVKQFTASGTTLYNITWTENVITGDASSKLENSVKTNNQIYDVATKTKLYENVQSVVNITEIVYLDKLKNASETQRRIRKEGSEFVLNTDGSFDLKGKSTTTMVYNAKDKKYTFKR